MVADGELPVVADGVQGRMGLLVISAWIEPRAKEPLRARLTQTLGGQASVATVISVDGVVQVVEAWLRSLLEDASTQ
jgi:hypothetical protein